jgi:SAM-dependent methyltransferase
MEANIMRRTSRYHILEQLEKQNNLRVVDLGCGTSGSCPSADVLVDRADWSEKFPDKEFVVHDLNNLPLPFSDGEFDFSFCSHILEHVDDPVKFLSEVTRISKSGYIEVPSPIIDNLVSGNDVHDPFGHKWWCFFNDVENRLVLRPRRHIVQTTVSIPELNMLYPFFRPSFVLEIYWEDDIALEMGDEVYFYEDKMYDLSAANVTPWRMGQS